jgi:hypothetical protein
MTFRQRKLQYFRLPREVRAAGLARIEAKVEELNLHVDGKVGQVIIKPKTNNILDVGNDRAVQSTLVRYDGINDLVLEFLIEMKLYDQAMLFHRAGCPSQPLSPSTDSLLLCLKRYYLPRNTVLTDELGDVVISPTTGEPMLCHGRWNSPTSIDLFRNAVQKLISQYERTTQPYKAPCPGCVALPSHLRHTGCSIHPGDPRCWLEGNPLHSNLFLNRFDSYLKQAKENYESRGTVALTPHDLRRIREHLLTFNDPYHEMIWTIMIVGIRAILRCAEATGLQMTDLKMEYFVMSEFNIEGLAMDIKGKSDPAHVLLAMWDDEECPDFSSSRALFIWLAHSGIRSGCLFPSKAELKKMADDPSYRTPTESLSYDDFMDELKYLIFNVLDYRVKGEIDPCIIIGTHALRKTGFLLAYWGLKRYVDPNAISNVSLDVANILDCARHTSAAHTKTYLGDSAALYQVHMALENKDTTEKVGPWKSIIIKRRSNFTRYNVSSAKWLARFSSVSEIAKWYVHTIVGVPVHFTGFFVASIHHEVCFKFNRKVTGEEEVRHIFYHYRMTEDEKATVERYYSQLADDKVAAAIEKHLSLYQNNVANSLHVLPDGRASETLPAPVARNLAGGGVLEMGIVATETLTVIGVSDTVAIATDSSTETIAMGGAEEPPTKKRKRTPVEWKPGMDYQAMIRKAGGKNGGGKAKQLQLCVEADKEVREQQARGHELCGNTKSFVYKMGKVVCCLHECHAGNHELMLTCNPNFVVSKYVCLKPPGSEPPGNVEHSADYPNNYV